MKYIFYFISTLVIFIQMVLSHRFYEFMMKEKLSAKLKYTLMCIQFLFMIFYPYLKDSYPYTTNITFWFMLVLPLFFYHEKFSNKIITGIIDIIAILITELLLSGAVVTLSYIRKDNFLFVIDLRAQYSVWFIILGIVDDILFGLMIYFIMWFQKKNQLKELKKIVGFPFVQIVLMIYFSDVLYAMKSLKVFYYYSIFYWLGFLVVIALFYKGIQKFKTQEIEYMNNKQRKEIIKVQMESLEQIDQSYRKLRKQNHDFQNYCLILLKLLEDHEIQKAIEYIDMLINHYENQQKGEVNI